MQFGQASAVLAIVHALPTPIDPNEVTCSTFIWLKAVLDGLTADPQQLEATERSNPSAGFASAPVVWSSRGLLGRPYNGTGEACFLERRC
jgi:hypothetical protein